MIDDVGEESSKSDEKGVGQRVEGRKAGIGERKRRDSPAIDVFAA